MVVEGNKVTEMLLSKWALYGMLEHGLAVWEKDYLRPEPEFAKNLAETFARRVGGALIRFWFDDRAGGLFCEVEGGLRPENDVVDSMANGRWLSVLHGKVMAVRLEYSKARGQRTYALYADGYQFMFTGFGWGYPNAAASGLASWATENNVPLTVAQVYSLPATQEGILEDWHRKPRE